MKHIVKHSFFTTLTPEQRDNLVKYKRYWNIYNLTTKQTEKYLKVDGIAHLHFFYTLNAGTYHISNTQDKYILTVLNDGTFSVKDLGESKRPNYSEYMFTD